MAHFPAGVRSVLRLRSPPPPPISALNLSLLIVAIVVPLNVVFGVPTALVLARNRFRGRGVLQAIIDLPFAVSPVVVGVALIVLWGSAGGWASSRRTSGSRSSSACRASCSPASSSRCRSSCARSNRCCTRLGTDQEQAAATLGARWWQTFWRITLPSIRWGLTYGIVLTVARTLGEFGAVIMVSSNLPGTSQTLTLLVQTATTEEHKYGAYALLDAADGRCGGGADRPSVLDARRARAPDRPDKEIRR